MFGIWRWIVSLIVWLASDPATPHTEHARAAAAVSVARASMVTGTTPQPAPAPTPVACDCGGTCQGGVWKPDGRIPQKCLCQCQRCKAERAKGPPIIPGVAPRVTGTCVSGTCVRK